MNAETRCLTGVNNIFQSIKYGENNLVKYKFPILDPGVQPPSRSYFSVVLKTLCLDINIWKPRRFANCSVQEELKDAVTQAPSTHSDTSDQRNHLPTHLKMVFGEHLQYKIKCKKVKFYPKNYLQIIIYRAHQCSLANWVLQFQLSKNAGTQWKGHCLACLDMVLPTQLLSSIHQKRKHQNGSNHNVETSPRYINERISPVPQRILYVQLDICKREKNVFTFVYYERLVPCHLFAKTIWSSLPVYHTHEDIDQRFSIAANTFRRNDAINIEDIHSHHPQTINKCISMTNMS